MHKILKYIREIVLSKKFIKYMENTRIVDEKRKGLR